MVNDEVKNSGIRYAASALSAALDEYTKAGNEYIGKSGMSASENTNIEISRKGWSYIKGHIERDTHFKSVINTRINSLIANPWKIVPAQTVINGRIVIKPEDVMIADFVRDTLSRVEKGFESDIVAMMNHISRGFSLSEINWAYNDSGTYSGKLGIRSIRYKQPELFSFKFDDKGYYRLNQVDPEIKEINMQNKFVHFINGLDDENPYGESIAAMCAFWVYLKENGSKFWAVFAERFGMPFASLEVPPNMSDDDKNKADEIVKKIHTSTGMQIPKGMVLSYLEAQRSGDANYRGLLEMADNEMSKVILGSTLAVETQKNTTSTHAASRSHENTMGIQLNFDVISSMSGINQQLIKPLVNFNFNGVTNYPKFVWGTFDVSGFITLAQGIEALLRSGAAIPKSWLHEITTIPYPMEGEDVLVYLPGMPSISDPNGVDKRAFNKGFMDEIYWHRHTKIMADNETDDKVKEAEAEDKNNTSVLEMCKAEIIKRWDKFAKQIAKTRNYDRQILAEFEQNELTGVISQFLLISVLNGINSGKKEIGEFLDDNNIDLFGKMDKNGLYGRNGQDIISFAGSYKPFDDILKQFIKLNLISKEAYNLLSKEMQLRAFTVTNHDTEYVLSILHDELMRVLVGAADLPDFYERVIGIFNQAGLIGAGNHIETVLRTNMQNQYIYGRERVFAMTETSEFPYKQVVCVLDSATRAEHARLNKYTKSRLDPVWGWLRPPFDYNCRCTLRLVHKSEQVTESDWVPDRGNYGLV